MRLLTLPLDKLWHRQRLGGRHCLRKPSRRVHLRVILACYTISPHDGRLRASQWYDSNPVIEEYLLLTFKGSGSQPSSSLRFVPAADILILGEAACAAYPPHSPLNDPDI